MLAGGVQHVLEGGSGIAGGGADPVGPNDPVGPRRIRQVGRRVCEEDGGRALGATVGAPASIFGARGDLFRTALRGAVLLGTVLDVFVLALPLRAGILRPSALLQIGAAESDCVTDRESRRV